MSLLTLKFQIKFPISLSGHGGVCPTH